MCVGICEYVTIFFVAGTARRFEIVGNWGEVLEGGRKARRGVEDGVWTCVGQ